MDHYFEKRYRDGCIPWDHGMADSNLIRIVDRFGIAPCKALDIGCGTGDNVAWLAERGFSVTGCDLSKTAIQMAQSKPGAGACRFVAADFLTHPFPKSSFGFVLDRGCFHSVEGTSARRDFAAKVADVLEEGGPLAVARRQCRRSAPRRRAAPDERHADRHPRGTLLRNTPP